MATIDDTLAKAVVEGFRLAQLDIENQQALLETPIGQSVTLTFSDGSTYTGIGFQEIAALANKSDLGIIGPVADQIAADRKIVQDGIPKVTSAISTVTTANQNAQTAAANAGGSATAAATSATASAASATQAEGFKNAAEAARAVVALSQNDAAASATAAAGSASAAATSATAAAGSATASANSASDAAKSAAAAKVSEDNAAASAAIALDAQAAAESAQSGAQRALSDTQTARDEALTARTEAEAQADAARIQADRAEAKAQEFFDNSSLVTHIKISPFTENGATSDRADFDAMPLVNGVPLLQASTSGGMQINSNETCAKTDDLNADVWKGKTFMVEKPTTGSAGNGAPAGLEYDFALCTDCYATWRPRGTLTNQTQRIQIIYDQNHIWLREYRAQSTAAVKWTIWRKIAVQSINDVTGMDLNTIKVTGQYNYTTAVNAPKIDASEASSVYFVRVVSSDDGLDVLQTVFSPKTNSRFDRYFISPNWSGWWNTTATFDVDTAAAGVDLNTLVNPGWWGIPLASALNLPTGIAKTDQGVLQVAGTSDGATFQRLHIPANAGVYLRSKGKNDAAGKSATWSSWRTIPTVDASNPLPVASGGTGANTAALAKKNLGLDLYAQDTAAGTTIISAPAGDYSLVVKDVATWGVWSKSKNDYQPLGIQQGGTGAKTSYDALKNLGVPGIGSANGGDVPGNSKDANVIRNSGIYAGAGDGSVNWFQGYSPLLHMSRYSGGTQGQFQIMNDGRCATRGSSDGGATWSAWKELAKIGDYGLGATTPVSLNAKPGFISDANGATDIFPSNGCGFQSQYDDSRIGQLWINPVGQVYARWTQTGGLAKKALVPWSPLAHLDKANSFLAKQSFTQGIGVSKGISCAGGAQFDTVNASSTIIATGNITGGGLIATVDAAIRRNLSVDGNITVKGVEAAIILNTPAAKAGYIIGKLNNANNWYFGRGSATSNQLTWHSYAMATTLQMGADKKLTYSGGTVAFTGTISASDARLKDNISAIPDSLAKLCTLTGVRFDWNEKANIEANVVGHGVIAQEVEKVLPEAIRPAPQEGYKGVDYNAIIALSVNAIKELKAELDAVKTELAELKTPQ